MGHKLFSILESVSTNASISFLCLWHYCNKGDWLTSAQGFSNIYFKFNEYLMIQLICQPIIVQKLSFLLLLAPATGVDASSLSSHEVLPRVLMVVRGATERCGVRGKGVGEGAALESISTKKTMRRSQTRRTLKKKSVENLGEGWSGPCHFPHFQKRK